MPPPSGSCADLVPARVSPRSITMYDGMSDFCGQATSDGSGTFMAPKYQNAMITLVPEPISFWGGDGTWSVQTTSVAGHDGLYYAQVVPGPSGFVAFSLGHGLDYPGRAYSVFDGRGNETRPVVLAWEPPFTTSGPRWPADVALAGDGRSVMTVATAGCGDTMFGLHAMRFAANGDIDVPRFPVVAISGEALEARAPDRFALYPKRMTENILAGTDGAGRILVTWEGGVTCGPRTIAARWFDPSGAPLSPVFRAATDANPPLRMARLMDGSLVLQTMYDGKWIRRFVAPVAAAGPVPDWLAARGDEIVTIRGGRAYATLPVDTECNPRIEILSPMGEVCGVLGYPKVPGATIEPCDPRSFWPAGRLHVGADGSVSRLKRQVSTWTCTSPTTGYGTNCCEYEWWLGELR